MPRYMLFAKFTAAELAARTAAGPAASEVGFAQVWGAVDGTIEHWWWGTAADSWDVVAVVNASSDAIFAVANAVVSAGAIERADFMELRTSEEAVKALSLLKPPEG